jgi:hypothetical protein
MELQEDHREHAPFDEMLHAKSKDISCASHLYATTIGLALAKDLQM